MEEEGREGMNPAVCLCERWGGWVGGWMDGLGI